MIDGPGPGGRRLGRRLRSLAALLAPILLLACSRGGTEGLEERLAVTWEEFPTLAARAREAVATTTGVDLSGLRVVEADTAAIGRSMVGNLAMSRSGEALADPLLGDAVARFAPAMLGIYDVRQGEVRVAWEHFLHVARALDEPGLVEPGAVFALLAHEIAHAAADRRYGLRRLLSGVAARGQDSLRAASGVVEGYAQYVARRVCAAAGWEQGFAVMTRSMGTIPETEDPAQAYLASLLVEAFFAGYRDGERFVEAVVADRGEEVGLALVFVRPPASPVELEHPQWYLDPASRPSSELDLEAGLAAAEAAFPGWEGEFQRMALTTAMLRTAMQPAGAELADQVADWVEEARLTRSQSDPTGLVTAALFACTNPAAARRMVAAEEAVSRAKDEQLSEGRVRIIATRYQSLAEGEGPGGDFLVRKKVAVGNMDMIVRTLVLRQDRLVLELMVTSKEPDRADLIAIGRRILAAARGAEPAD